MLSKTALNCALPLCEPQRLNPLEEHLWRCGVLVEQSDYLADVVGQWHGTRIGFLMYSLQFRGDVGRYDLHHLDLRRPKLKAQRFYPGVKRGFRGCVGRGRRSWHKSQSRCDNGNACLTHSLKCGSRAAFSRSVPRDWSESSPPRRHSCRHPKGPHPSWFRRYG